jgi:hypothetical protein
MKNRDATVSHPGFGSRGLWLASYLRELAPFGCRRRIDARRTARPRRTIRRASGLPVAVAASSVLVGGRVTFGVPSTPRTSPPDEEEAISSTELVVDATELVVEATELVVEATELVVLVVDETLDSLETLLVELDSLETLDSLLVVVVWFGFAQKTAWLTSGTLPLPTIGAARPVSDVTAGEYAYSL